MLGRGPVRCMPSSYRDALITYTSIDSLLINTWNSKSYTNGLESYMEEPLLYTITVLLVINTFL